MDLKDISTILTEFKNDFKDFKKDVYGYFGKVDSCLSSCREANEMNLKQNEKIDKLELDLNNLANKERQLEEKVKKHESIFSKITWIVVTAVILGLLALLGLKI